jgi:PKD repeat protein
MARAVGRRLVIALAIAVAGLAIVPSVTWTGTGPPAASTDSSVPTPSGPVIVAPAFVPGPGVRSLGALAGGTPLEVAVALASPDPAGLQEQLNLEYAAGSPEAGHFLSAAEVAARYAPSPAAYTSAVRYFEAAGASVRVSPDRWMLLVQGPATTIGAAFHTEFDAYSASGRTFYSHPTPSILPPIAPWSGVVGLGNETPVIPFATPTGSLAPPTTDTGCSGAEPYTPCAVADAYNLSSLYAAGTNGSGVRVGIVDTYDGNEKQSTLASDLATFTAAFGLHVGSVHYLYPVPTPVNLNFTSTGWATEEALDLEWSRAAAPGAALDMTFAPDATAGLYYAVDWLVANQLVNVISLSWGEPDVGQFNTYSTPCASECNATSDGSYDVLHPVLAAAALEGIGVFSASGDCGAAMGTAGDATSYPASDPDATGVGATDLTLQGTQWDGETGWSGNATGVSAPGCQNQGGSGGGFSPFPRPYWQSAPGVPSTPDVRGVPDVSLVGGTPVEIVESGFGEGVTGTSVATPIWAGLEAVADQLDGGPLGLLNPALYALARGPSADSYFHDVVSGSNGYLAGPGWDPVTGLGTPNAARLLPALAGGTGQVPAVAPGLEAFDRTGPAPLNVRFQATVPMTAPPVAGYDVYFGDGNATWTSNGSASHIYPEPGVYAAQSVVFYVDGNSSASSPALVLAGVGPPISVTLRVNDTSPSIDSPVGFNVTAVGGAAPYRFGYYFGDGTYYLNATSSAWSHEYGTAGSYCAVVIVTDSSGSPSGGASLEVPVTVGGAAPPSCPDSSPLSVVLPPEPAAMDLPANVDLAATVSGNAGPVSLQFVSDDPYVTDCQCGIFRVPGNHTIRAYANDSLSGEATAQVNLTVYPALDGSFSAEIPGDPSAPPIGPAPLALDFSATVSGGHNASAGSTVWTFGDGSPDSTGATTTHSYSGPGLYVAEAVVHDPFNGTAAQAFLVDVLPDVTPLPVGISATISLGPGAAAGNLVGFGASTSSSESGIGFSWQLGDNDSAFGYAPTQSYTTGCLAAGACSLSIQLNASTSQGPVANASFTLPFPFFGRSSALQLMDRLAGTGGATPYPFNGSATATGMPGAGVTWQFGDGNTSGGSVVSHTFYRPGNYTVVETAQDTIGDVEVRSHEVVVTGPPVPPLTVIGGPSELNGTVPLAVVFHANASGGFGAPYTYEWQFGDGATAAGPWANHTYDLRGNYSVNLSLVDSRGTLSLLQWVVRAYNATTVVLLVSVFPASASPGAPILLNVTPEPTCTNASVPGCSSANTTFAVVAAAFDLQRLDITPNGSPVATTQFAGEGPPSTGEFPIWVNATGMFRGSAEVVLAVVPAGGGGLSGIREVELSGVLAGTVAATVLALGFQRRRRPTAIP